MFHAALICATLSTFLPVRVQSDTCPSGDEVERALEPMLPPLARAGRPDWAHIVRQGSLLQIELINPDGAVIVQRSIDNAGSCAGLAEIVAVVIASWESDVHPEFSRPQAEIAAAPAAPASTPLPTEATRAAPASYDVAGGGGLSVADSAVLAGVITGVWVPRGTGLGGHLLVLGERDHGTTLGTGRAEWHRWSASAGLDWRGTRGKVALDLHGGLALALLVGNGSGFSPSHSARSWTPGLGAGARASLWASRHVAVWLSVTGFYWQRSQVLTTGSTPVVEREVPHFQWLASFGLAVGRAPQAR